MKLRKFFGLTSRSVLEQVRTELGADAVIVGNRPTAEGIEITALASEAIDTLLSKSTVTPSRPASQPELERAVSSPAGPSEPRRWDPLRIARSASPRVDDADGAPVLESVAVAVAAAKDADTAPETKPSLDARLMEEVMAMRALLEGQLAQLAWGDTVRRAPLRAGLTRDLLGAGYSAALARELTQRLPDDYSAAQASAWLTGVVAKNLRCVEADHDLVTRGGVYALIGPTGVGKTTTAAKLAARCAVRYGAREIALLTTDSYRVGAHDQLRIYAKILGVAVHTVSDREDLRQALDSLRGKRLVLIDTVGMGQRDQRVAEQAMLLSQREVKRVLLLNATAQAETLDEVVAAYGSAGCEATGDLAGCIVTKIDEAARPGHVLDVLIRHRLALQYVSNGQRVPEDMHPANATYLVHRSLKPLARSSPFALRDDELGLRLGHGAGMAHA